jgi:hypothetical protein
MVQRIMITILALLLLLPLQLQAQPLPCVLSETIYVNPSSVQDVARDRDGDFLKDDLENQLADWFKPYFKNDSAENATRPFGPVVFFQVTPQGCCGMNGYVAPQMLRIHWAFLWQRDGGYGPCSWCSDAHDGDNQSVEYLLLSSNGGVSWRLESILNGDFHWPQQYRTIEWYQQSHPVIYFSAGKHHHFFDTRFDCEDSPYSSWGCNDNVDGKGVQKIAVIAVGESTSFTDYPHWNNVGEPKTHLLEKLDGYGFPGETLWSELPFTGGLNSGVRNNPTSPMKNLWHEWHHWLAK